MSVFSGLMPELCRADKNNVTSVIAWLSFLLIQDPEKLRAQMAAAMTQQRASAQMQAQAVGSWVATDSQDGAGGATQADCDPVPKPELTKMIDGAAKKAGVDPALVTEVARKESGFRPCAVSSKGAQGLMQLMPQTQWTFAVSNPFDAHQSVEGGTKLLKQLLDRFHGDLKRTLAAYNAGTALVEKSGGIPEIPETQNYVHDILRRMP